VDSQISIVTAKFELWKASRLESHGEELLALLDQLIIKRRPLKFDCPTRTRTASPASPDTVESHPTEKSWCVTWLRDGQWQAAVQTSLKKSEGRAPPVRSSTNSSLFRTWVCHETLAAADRSRVRYFPFRLHTARAAGCATHGYRAKHRSYSFRARNNTAKLALVFPKSPLHVCSGHFDRNHVVSRVRSVSTDSPSPRYR